MNRHAIGNKVCAISIIVLLLIAIAVMIYLNITKKWCVCWNQLAGVVVALEMSYFHAAKIYFG